VYLKLSFTAARFQVNHNTVHAGWTRCQKNKQLAAWLCYLKGAVHWLFFYSFSFLSFFLSFFFFFCFFSEIPKLFL